MTITVDETQSSACQFIRVSMGQGDEFVLDFSKGHSFGTSSPNGLSGIQVRMNVGAGMGITGKIAMGNRDTFETTYVAANASATEFYLNDQLPENAIGKAIWCRNESDNNDVKAVKSYDSATRKITLFEAFQRTVLPTDVLSFDFAEDLDPAPKTIAGSTATKLRFDETGRSRIFNNYDISMTTGSGNTLTKQTRKVTAVTNVRTERSGSPNFNASAVDTANNTITIGTDANYRTLESAATVYIAATGGFSGWSVGDILELRVTGGSERKFTVWTESGTQVSFDGSGNPSNIQMRLTDLAVDYTLNSALSAAPAVGQVFDVVSGANFGKTHATVETSVAATTTVIPLYPWDTNITAAHDVIIGDDGVIRDVASVQSNNRTITLTTALSAAPAVGTKVEVGVHSEDFHDESALTVTTGDTTRIKTLHITWPFTAIQFSSVGGAANTSGVIEVSGVNLPQVQEKI